MRSILPGKLCVNGLKQQTVQWNEILTLSARAGSGVVRMDPLRFLAGCRTRRLNQA